MMRWRTRPGAVLAALVILVLCSGTGCGRKAKPEPLRNAAVCSVILNS